MQLRHIFVELAQVDITTWWSYQWDSKLFLSHFKEYFQECLKSEETVDLDLELEAECNITLDFNQNMFESVMW